MTRHIKIQYKLLLVYLILLFKASEPTYGQTNPLNFSQNQNYIAVYSPIDSLLTNLTTLYSAVSDATKVQVTVQYFDGLGRNLQTVQVKAAPGNNTDLVQPFAYDQMSRQPYKYLPYAENTSNDGSYKTAAIGTGEASFYNPTGSGVSGAQQTNGVVVNPFPYSVTSYEASPANRAIEQGAPGTTWQLGTSIGSDHTMREVYTANDQTTTFSSTYSAGTPNPGCKTVALYTVTINSGLSRTLVWNGTSTYAPNSLHEVTTKDENWTSSMGCLGTTETYTDNFGRTVLKRTYNLSNNQVQMLSTYYVYDEFNNLCFVLPPQSLPDSGLPGSIVLSNYCYQYVYDDRNRLIQKKMPGVDWSYYVYNNNDKLVLSQDGNQRLSNQWTVAKYDALGREVITGVWNAGSVISQSALQSSIYAAAQFETRDAANNGTTNPTGYVIGSYPSLSNVLTINYYDDYLFLGNPYANITSLQTARVFGLLTASKAAVLNADGTINSQMLWTVHCYDVFGRESILIKQHYKGGAAGYNTANFDITSKTYSFDNMLLHSSFAHITSDSQTPKIGIGTSYFYDQVNRPTQIWKAIWNEAFPQPAGLLTVQNNYNGIGQIKTKQLHSPNGGQTFIQNINYAYNERGWLAAINNPASISATQVFGEQLQYASGSTPQYNGNIAGVNWQTMEPVGMSQPFQQQQSYAYSYDNLNRLTLGAYSNALAQTNKFNELLGYDLNGNITSLKRTNTTTAGLYYNNFTYDYTSQGVGNKLYGVSDQGTAAQGSTYQYDPNGNVTADSHRQITTTKYNLLNLPATVTRTPGNINYIYDANGEKLEKISAGVTRDYIDGIEYNSGVVDFVTTEEGRAFPSGNNYVYDYYLKDHLGNTRAAIDQTGTIVQVQDYYTFGLEMNPGNSVSPSPLNRYKYNDKEEQDETGLYDYGARFYDPVTARWNSVDPLAELERRISPYNYGDNNPIRNIDPDGMWTTDKQGNSSTNDASEIAAFIGQAEGQSDVQKVLKESDPGSGKKQNKTKSKVETIKNSHTNFAGTLALESTAAESEGYANPYADVVLGATLIAAPIAGTAEKIRDNLPTGVQYSLIATKSGRYPVYSWGNAAPTSYEWLNAGEIWKIGETIQYDPVTQKQWRYSNSYLQSIGVRFLPEVEGTKPVIYRVQLQKIILYMIDHHWSLPPGNKGIN